MQVRSSWIGKFLAIALALFIAEGVAPVAQGAQMTQGVPAAEPIHRITVLGYGDAASAADSVLIRLAVNTQSNYGPLGPEFTPLDEEGLQTLVDALIENGIAASKITTKIFGWSMYNNVSSGEVAFSYGEPGNLNQFLTEVQETLEDNRGTPLQSITTNFHVENCAELESEAWQAALEDARERAEHVAELMDVQLSELITVAELEPAISAYGTSSGGGGCAVLEVETSILMPTPSTQSASEVEVSIRLQATFAFE